jgi:hypothetical protein
MFRVLHHDALHQTNKLCLFLTLKRMKGSAMRLASRFLNSAQKLLACGGQFADSRTPIIFADRPLDQLSGFKPLQNARRRGAIQSNISRQAGLIGGSARSECRKKAILKRRYFQSGACFLKQGDMNLVQTTDQVARALIERPRPMLTALLVLHQQLLLP